MVTETAGAKAEATLTEHPSEFRRSQHGLLALLALVVVAFNGHAGWWAAEQLGATWPWDGSDALLFYAIPLSAVSMISFLALVRPGTHSGVFLVGPRARQCGWEPLALAGLMWAFYLFGARFGRTDLVSTTAHTYFGVYRDGLGVVDWGWLIAATATYAAAEELTFRVLLQRALEGWLGEVKSVIVQATVFALVHVFAYDVAMGWLHFVAGLVFGIAFMRTRSFICPFLLHFIGNIVYALAFVPMLR